MVLAQTAALLRRSASLANASKKPKKATACEKKKKEKAKGDEPKKNTCPHCKKYHRKPYRVKPDKCMWNQKYKGYRFKSICDELEVNFKEPRSNIRRTWAGMR